MATNGTALRRRHVGELMSSLASDAGTLVRQEVDLAKAEIRERVDAVTAELGTAAETARTELEATAAQARRTARAVAGGAAMFGAAALTALLALGALTAAAIALLDDWFSVEVAAALVGTAWALIAATFALRGRDRFRAVDARGWTPTETLNALKKVGEAATVVPTETIETVKEDVQWVKTRGRSDAR